MTDERLGIDVVAAGHDVQLYALGATVYVERGEEILLLQRAEGTALAGQWFLPGGAIERDELPHEGARRELREEAGIEIVGELELVGAYPMHVYGLDMLNLSYRGRCADDTDVAVSNEHTGAQWVRAADMRAVLTPDVVADIAHGEPRIEAMLGHIVADLDRYLERVR
jgi:8-oxo-dGTP pyrophosphatase MutT (NUDIX family)